MARDVDIGTPSIIGTETIYSKVDTEVAATLTDTNAILVDTDEIQADLKDGGRLDLLIDAIKAKTDLIT